MGLNTRNKENKSWSQPIPFNTLYILLFHTGFHLKTEQCGTEKVPHSLMWTDG